MVDDVISIYEQFARTQFGPLMVKLTNFMHLDHNYKISISKVKDNVDSSGKF